MERRHQRHVNLQAPPPFLRRDLLFRRGKKDDRSRSMDIRETERTIFSFLFLNLNTALYKSIAETFSPTFDKLHSVKFE